MFDGVLKSFEETLTDNNTLDETLREKFYKTLKEEAVKSHTNEMRKAFERYASIMPYYNTSQVKFFPAIALIGIGIGIGLGKLVYDGITGSIHRFSEEEQRHKVCYPTTKEDDVGYLMRIVPLGEFSDDLKTFSRHKLSTHYIAPQSMHLANLSTLQEVADFGSSCVTIASTLLCKTRPQPFECGLARRRRRGLKSLISYQSSSKMAERILGSKKYKKVVEIGNAAKELKNEQIIRILLTEMKEGEG
ncbi:unnamed protein product [Strongylus vulgaris]|uniref:Uncharacterized protein n=1 Tax=Strongylus vulgaris TaxID=40348 RepID=A0A3P7LLU6_STRVU|nr:unnamed protein product [Strongylus vulgaris]